MKAQIECFGCPLFIDDCLGSLFDIGSREIQINPHFVQIRQKRYYNLKTTMFNRSSLKSVGFLRKNIQISMQNFRAIGATSIELQLQRDKILTTYRQTHRQIDRYTGRQTPIHKFSADDFFLIQRQGNTERRCPDTAGKRVQ